MLFNNHLSKNKATFKTSAVSQGFRLNLGARSKTITFGSLLTTFKVRICPVGPNRQIKINLSDFLIETVCKNLTSDPKIVAVIDS